MVGRRNDGLSFDGAERRVEITTPCRIVADIPAQPRIHFVQVDRWLLLLEKRYENVRNKLDVVFLA